MPATWQAGDIAGPILARSEIDQHNGFAAISGAVSVVLGVPPDRLYFFLQHQQGGRFGKGFLLA